MNFKRRLMALVLCALMVVPALLTSCGSKIDEDNKGAVINMYLSDGLVSFDPAYSLNDDAALKIMGMVYEGLFKIDSKGKVQNAVAKSVEIIEKPDDGIYMMEIELKNSMWSDGRVLQASDYLYAWQRILDPEMNNPAAAALYDIKNARQVKSGDCSIDDIGARAVGTTTLQIEFEKKIDYNRFKETLASPYFAPLRKDVVNKAEDWASTVAIMTFNGPFTVRTFIPGETIVLERNSYYLRNRDKDALDKYVTPYQIVIDLTKKKAEQLNMYNEGTLFLNGDLPVSARADWASVVKTSQSLASHTFYFNTNKEPFNKPEVRKALSLALDRTAVANLITFATPATGVITEGVFDTKVGTSFRKNGGDLIASTANMEEAKSLLKSAGVSGGSFTITVRDNDVDRAIADYAKDVWGELGFKVTVVLKKSTKYKTETEYDVYKDEYNKVLASGEFDVIGLDMIMIATDPYATLAPFAVNFSGGALDFENMKFDAAPHITGYRNEAYDALIEQVYASVDAAERATLLHQAEEMLINDMPICPVVFLQNAYVASGELSKVKTDYYGLMDLEKTQLKNWEAYIVEETAPVEE